MGDCLLAASFLSYAGAFTSDFRAGMIYDTFAKSARSLRVFRGAFLGRSRSERVHLTTPSGGLFFDRVRSDSQRVADRDALRMDVVAGAARGRDDALRRS